MISILSETLARRGWRHRLDRRMDGLLQVVDLFLHEEAAPRDRDVVGDAETGPWAPVARAEGSLMKISIPSASWAAEAGIVLLLLLIETDVLEDEGLAFARPALAARPRGR